MQLGANKMLISGGALPMVGPRKGTVEKAFGRRLSQALDDHPRCPEGYGRNTWLMHELAHANVRVSLETIRKWLVGETMPRRPKMAALAKILQVDETWLAMGNQPVAVSGPEKRIKELEKALRRIARITDDERVSAIISDLIQV